MYEQEVRGMEGMGDHTKSHDYDERCLAFLELSLQPILANIRQVPSDCSFMRDSEWGCSAAHPLPAS